MAPPRRSAEMSNSPMPAIGVIGPTVKLKPVPLAVADASMAALLASPDHSETMTSQLPKVTAKPKLATIVVPEPEGFKAI